MAVMEFDSHWRRDANHRTGVGSRRDAQNLRDTPPCGYRILVDLQMLRRYQPLNPMKNMMEGYFPY